MHVCMLAVHACLRLERVSFYVLQKPFMRRNKVSWPMMLNLLSFKHKWNSGNQLLREVKVKLSDSNSQLGMKFDKYEVNVVCMFCGMCLRQSRTILWQGLCCHNKVTWGLWHHGLHCEFTHVCYAGRVLPVGSGARVHKQMLGTALTWDVSCTFSGKHSNFKQHCPCTYILISEGFLLH